MADVDIATRSRIIGLRTSAGPLRNVALQISEGITALYGRNGAGKSWILSALRQAFRGQQLPDTHLIVEIAPRTAASSWFAEAMKSQFPSASMSSPQEAMEQAMRRWFTQGGRYFRPTTGRSDVPEGLINELRDPRYIALVPVGVSESRWEVWVCTDADPRTAPVARGALDRFEQIERSLADLTSTIFELSDDVPGLDTEVWGRVAAQIRAVEALVGDRHENLGLDDILNPPPFPAPGMSGDEMASTLTSLESWADGAVGDTLFITELWGQLPVASWLWNNDRAFTQHGNAFDLDSGDLLRSLIEDHLPVPVACVGEVRDIPWLLEDEAVGEDLDELTSYYFAAALTGTLEDPPAEVATTPELETWVRSLAEDANGIYQSLLQDAPRLTLQIRSPHEWTISTPVAWRVLRTVPDVERRYRMATTTQLPIDALSTAESRWARIAIRRALDRVPQGSRAGFFWWPVLDVTQRRSDMIMIDEPEAALHRAAEQHMAHGLDGLTVAGPQVIVATHSPEILNRPEASLIHVTRTTTGATTARQMPKLDLERSAQELGLRPSDLIGMFRVFLLVEGEHDEIVLRALIPDVLESARVKIIAIRGGMKLPSTTESQLLFDMTSAHMVAMLDNITIARVEEIWDGAKERYLTSDPANAIEYLTSQLRILKGEEYQWLSSWLSRALKKGVNERLIPYGLEAQDIIEYLPVEVLVPKAGKPWAELRAEHAAALPGLGATRGLRDFKRWLQHTYKADISASNVERAAKDVTEVPREFTQLGHRLRETSSRRPTA